MSFSCFSTWSSYCGSNSLYFILHECLIYLMLWYCIGGGSCIPSMAPAYLYLCMSSTSRNRRRNVSTEGYVTSSWLFFFHIMFLYRLSPWTQIQLLDWIWLPGLISRPWYVLIIHRGTDGLSTGCLGYVWCNWQPLALWCDGCILDMFFYVVLLYFW